MRVLRNALPSDSYLVITHGTNDGIARDLVAQNERLYAQTTTPVKTRSREAIERFFDGFALVEPGLVYVPLWHPESAADLFLAQPARSVNFGGVGRKP